MSFTRLGDIMTSLTPLLNRALPLAGASLILGRFYSIIKK